MPSGVIGCLLLALTMCARVRVALAEARRKWVEDQVATAAGRSEQEFKTLAQETAARRRREVSGN